jgi:hypothetical protein
MHIEVVIPFPESVPSFIDYLMFNFALKFLDEMVKFVAHNPSFEISY